jgi:hypothetical protein
MRAIGLAPALAPASVPGPPSAPVPAAAPPLALEPGWTDGALGLRVGDDPPDEVPWLPEVPVPEPTTGVGVGVADFLDVALA